VRRVMGSPFDFVRLISATPGEQEQHQHSGAQRAAASNCFEPASLAG
jgi:hypothetical protein